MTRAMRSYLRYSHQYRNPRRLRQLREGLGRGSRRGDGGCGRRTLVSSENCSQAIVMYVVIWLGCSEGVLMRLVSGLLNSTLS